MINEWVDAIETARNDRQIRVLVVTGAGRGFCSGMDVRAAATGGSGSSGSGETSTLYTRRNFLRNYVHKVPRALESFDKPYIAAINGRDDNGKTDTFGRIHKLFPLACTGRVIG